MFARFNLGWGLRARPRCAQTTADSLGRSVRCQLPTQHVQAHRYMDEHESVIWGSADLVAAFRTGWDEPLSDLERRAPSDGRQGRWTASIPAPGRIVLPLLVSHFAHRTGSDEPAPPVGARHREQQRHRHRRTTHNS